MSNIKSIISTASLYIMFGVWSFIHMMEYKYFTRIEQYDSIVDNMDRCNKKYTELVLKMIHMENRIAELEDILYITDELSLSEEAAPKVVETTVASSNEVEETTVTSSNEVEETTVTSSNEVEETVKSLEETEKSLEETTVAPKVLEETTVASLVEEIIIKIEAEPKVVEVESVTSLEVESVTSLEVESVTSLEVEPKVLELVVEVVEEPKVLEVETTVASLVKEESKSVDNFDAGELVDLSSEEKETNSNKKGWVKTLLFL
jgi:hypothetical protein